MCNIRYCGSGLVSNCGAGRFATLVFFGAIRSYGLAAITVKKSWFGPKLLRVTMGMMIIMMAMMIMTMIVLMVMMMVMLIVVMVMMMMMMMMLTNCSIIAQSPGLRAAVLWGRQAAALWATGGKENARA